MIKKSIICSLILTIIHMLFVMMNPTAGMATHQWQSNVVRAQQFMYAEDSDTVMVGTSLSGRIISDSIPEVKSMSFGGCAVVDGLRIILAKEKAPKYILVETNLIFNKGNEELVSRVTQGIVPKIRRVIPSLREQYEPICLLASWIVKSTALNPQAGMSVVDMDLLNESINRKLGEDALAPEEELLGKLAIIKDLARQLEERGAKMAFFEMPVNELLTHLRRNEQRRELMQRVFPVDEYTYMPCDTSTYLTIDGEHLDFEGQQRFSGYFRRLLEEMDI